MTPKKIRIAFTAPRDKHSFDFPTQHGKRFNQLCRRRVSSLCRATRAHYLKSRSRQRNAKSIFLLSFTASRHRFPRMLRHTNDTLTGRHNRLTSIRMHNFPLPRCSVQFFKRVVSLFSGPSRVSHILYKRSYIYFIQKYLFCFKFNTRKKCQVLQQRDLANKKTIYIDMYIFRNIRFSQATYIIFVVKIAFVPTSLAALTRSDSSMRFSFADVNVMGIERADRPRRIDISQTSGSRIEIQFMDWAWAIRITLCARGSCQIIHERPE